MGGVIKAIHGRNEDYIICKDGSKVMRLDFIMKKAKNVKASQIVQESVGEAIIKVVPDTDFCEKDGDSILKALCERVGNNNLTVKTDIISLDELIYTTRGKFSYIVNKIK